MNQDSNDITLLLGRASDDVEVQDELYRLVEPHIRRIASRRLQGKTGSPVMQTTLVVNDAFLKLVRRELTWNNREHFFCIVADEVRRIVIDYWRMEHGRKGDRERPQALTPADEPAEEDTANSGPDPLELDEMLDQLKQELPGAHQVFMLHYYGELELKEIASTVLDLPYSTVRNRWRAAKGFLRQKWQQDF